ncbi:MULTISPECIES: MGMT family protein [Vibrio]|uniref:MGMT family protein n=1 Tax=Vibrio TaxID=662 RepID=UPI000AC0BCAE|nr:MULTISPECIES: MGMT family protein [Vibrio]EGR1117293.1 hypothetical protein [Vibrio cholerae]EGR1265366.1 hypothetical protein [Vibrio cholerae]EHP3506163.1 MGMT family protein [Vibrio cholerae]EJL6480347.1 MGMT family protein [Vibrio cholerae]EJL6849270.1 MGMT family protein [Vibrio cholerae]
MSNVNWRSVLDELKQFVPEGKITTYGDLSAKFYGHSSAGTAIGTMLKAAVNDDIRNATFTNRVVGSRGELINSNGQITQLTLEGIPIVDGKVVLDACKKATLS